MKKENKLPIEAIKGLTSALEDVKNGRYTVITNKKIKGCGDEIDTNGSCLTFICGRDGLCDRCKSQYQERANCLNDELLYRELEVNYRELKVNDRNNILRIRFLIEQLKALKEAGFEGK